MDMLVDRHKLISTLTRVCRFVQRRNINPIMQLAQFAANSGGLSVHGTDGANGVTAEVACDTQKSGSWLMCPHELIERLKLLSDETVRFKFSGDSYIELKSASGPRAFRLHRADNKDFPALPALPHGGASLSASTLMSLADQISYAVPGYTADIAGKYYAILERNDMGQFEIQVLDGHRSARSRANGGECGKPFVMFLPAQSLSHVRELDGDLLIVDELARTTVRAEGIAMWFGKTFQVAIDYRVHVPQPKACATISLKQFRESAKAIATAANQHTGILLTLTPSPGQIELYAYSPERGDARECMGCEYDGPPVEMALNERYLIDALSRAEGDTAQIDMAGSMAIISAGSYTAFIGMRDKSAGYPTPAD